MTCGVIPEAAKAAVRNSGSHCDVRNAWLHGFSGSGIDRPVAECQLSEINFPL